MLFLLSSKVQKKSVLLANFGSLWNSSHVQKMESKQRPVQQLLIAWGAQIVVAGSERGSS